MNRRDLLALLGAGTIGSTGGCGRPTAEDAGETEATTGTVVESPTATDQPRDSAVDPNSLRVDARVDAGAFQVPDGDDGWRSLLARGVNLGMGKPGAFPGEAAITREEYDRWLQQLGAANTNVVRVYTIHPPEFYTALAEYNADAAEPIYLLHGTWVPVERLVEAGNAYDTAVTEPFDRAIRETIDVVHGATTLPDRAGYASGTFDADISRYCLGHVPGVEWDPNVVMTTNEASPRDRYEGRFIRATGATAFEAWLAARLDLAARYEAREYGAQRPLSFVNWITTDPLSHPAEPLPLGDMVGVDPDVMTTTDHGAGLFATYHAYPYYPDFLNFSKEYLDATGPDGEPSSYAGYLRELVAATEHPLFIGEFGVPGSRGIAHEQVYGKDQGHHTEKQQGEINATLFATIAEADTLGSAVFSWQDEWFKRTWNTAAFTDPDRRPAWLNVESPEERFGLLSFDPGGPNRVTLSGDDGEWAGTETVATAADGPRIRLNDGADDARTLTQVEVTHDPHALLLRLHYRNLTEPVDWETMHTGVGLSVTPDRGIQSFPFGLDTQVNEGIDFAVHLAGPDDSRIVADSHYDQFYYRFGELEEAIETRPYASDPDTDRFHPMRMALSYALDLPTQDRTVPFRAFETGQLRYGVGNPTASDYDSMTDVHVDAAANTIELRVPWLLLNFRDPSTRRIAADIWTEGLDAAEQTPGVGVSAVTFRPTDDGTAEKRSGDGNHTDALPHTGNGRPAITDRYTWDSWQDPAYTERVKQSYDAVASVFDRYS